jgi:hypothetical protein
MLTFDDHPGFSAGDLCFLLFRCNACHRIFSVITENGVVDESLEEWTIHTCVRAAQ